MLVSRSYNGGIIISSTWLNVYLGPGQLLAVPVEAELDAAALERLRVQPRRDVGCLAIICLAIYMYTYGYTYIYIYRCFNACITYIYMYMCIYVYIYTYIPRRTKSNALSTSNYY